jgi:cytochrome c oxidase subunit IV
MSSPAETHSHSHHIISFKTLVATGIALTILTALTVGVYYINFPDPINIIVALGIAIVKATLVGAIFMGLYWDNKFYTIILLMAFLFFIVFVGITLLDTLFRDPSIIIY